MLTNNDKILTLPEVASYLQIGERTVLKMVHQNEIPSVKIANQWRFIKSYIDTWLVAKIEKPPQNFFATTDYPLSRLIKPEFTISRIIPGTKPEILQQLINSLSKAGIVKHPQNYLKKLLAREEMLSTGLANGLAIPHIRNVQENEKNTPLIVLGICSQGTDFNSLDKKLTYFFTLVHTNNEIIHLQVISKISSVFRDKEFSDKLRQVNNFDEILTLLIEQEYRQKFIKNI